MPLSIPTYFAVRFVSTKKLPDRISLIGNSYKAQLLSFFTIGAIYPSINDKDKSSLLYGENSVLFNYR